MSGRVAVNLDGTYFFSIFDGSKWCGPNELHSCKKEILEFREPKLEDAKDETSIKFTLFTFTSDYALSDSNS